MIGSPMDSTGFAGLSGALADDYTVVTYDPRGTGNSSREDTTHDVTPEQQADDVHRLLSALGSEPAHVFGSSGEPSSGSRSHRPPRPGAYAGRPRAPGRRVAARQRARARPDR